jgi:hypothetical protein
MAGKLYGFAEDRQIRRVIRAVRRVESMPIGRLGQRRQVPLMEDAREHIWLPFKNETGETIPAGAILKVNDYDPETENFSVAKYDQFGAVYPTAVNDLVAVEDDDFGVMTFTFPALVLYDDTDTPAFGESWGPVNGQWDARLRSVGFRVIGIESADDKTMLVDRVHELSFFGELDSGTVAQDATGTVSVHYYATATWTEETDSNHNVTCRNPTDTTISAGQRVGCNWHGASNQWTMLPVTCA